MHNEILRLKVYTFQGPSVHISGDRRGFSTHISRLFSFSISSPPSEFPETQVGERGACDGTNRRGRRLPKFQGETCQVLHTQKYICITWPRAHTYPVSSSISKIFKRCLEQVIWVLLQKGSKTDQEYFNMCRVADPWNCIFKSSLVHIFTNFPRHKL